MLSKFTVITDLCFGLARENFLKMSDQYNYITLEIKLYLVDEILSVLKQSCHRYKIHAFSNSTTYILDNFQTADIYLFCGTQISSSDFISTSLSCSNHESSESRTQHFPKLLSYFLAPYAAA